MRLEIKNFFFWNNCLTVYTYQDSSPGAGGGVTVRIGNLSICILFVFITQGAFADAVIDEARELMGQQQAEAAFALLDPLEEERSGDPEFDYLLGIAALDSGNVTRAIFALERVLIVEPGNDVARAEIARAHFLVGERETARREFQTARQSGAAPTEAIQLIDKYLELLERARPPAELGTTVSGYIDVTLGYDSNVNSATDEDSVVIPAFAALAALNPAFGGPFPLSANAREIEQGFAQVAGAVNVVHAFGKAGASSAARAG